MNIAEAKSIPLAGYLQSIGITPCRKQGNNLWYYSPFRQETEASFKVNLIRNQWFDFGMGKGGNMLDFVMEQQGIEDISHVLQILSGKASMISPANSFSFRPQENLSAYEDIRIQPLENPLLIQYLKERQINIPYAQQVCGEVHFKFKDKSYFAIGFENNLGGYELRNKYFQGTISPKGITTIKQGNDSCCIFEGFMDYLSYLTLKQKHNPEYPNIGKQDYIILNSVSNTLKAIDIISGYKAKYCYLDNDKAGASTYEEIRNKCGLNVSDRSVHYLGYKDLNDYLCGKKQVQEKRQSRGMKR
ncbi:DNA primase [termite gut metagenome]|uniref:DNA primase n=1 Tax=termite gut metagenome TaxID=433724 RepID=A0A5J4RUQ0_9ZZZZ